MKQTQYCHLMAAVYITPHISAWLGIAACATFLIMAAWNQYKEATNVG